MQLAVLIEGRPGPVEQRSTEIATLLRTSDIRPGPPPRWGELPGPVTLKLTSVLSAVPALVDQASSSARDHAVSASIAGSAGSGVLFMGLPLEVEAEALRSLLGDVRRSCAAFGGHAIVLRAPAPLKAAVDVWGASPRYRADAAGKRKVRPGSPALPGPLRRRDINGGHR